MKKKYFNTLQILRAVAFLTIYLSHCLIVDGAFSRWGVTVFFVLSGFLNAIHGYDKKLDCSVKGSVNYGIKKVKKLFPLHVVMVFIAFILYTVSNASAFLVEIPKSIVIAVLKLIANIFLITDWLPSEGITNVIFSEYNIVTWYLSASLLFYFFTPIILKGLKALFSRKEEDNNILKMVSVILIIYVFVIVENILLLNILGLDRVFWYAYENPLSRIGDYVIGLFLGCLYLCKTDSLIDGDKQGCVQNKIAVPCALVIISIFLSILLLYIGINVFDNSHKWIISTGFYYTIPVAGLVIGLAFLESFINEKVWENVAIKKIIYFGTLSAYTYLIHVPAINLVHAIYKRLAVVNVYIWGAISMLITVAVAVVVYEKGKSKRVK